MKYKYINEYASEQVTDQEDATDKNTTDIEEKTILLWKVVNNKWLVKVKRKKDVDNYGMVDY